MFDSNLIGRNTIREEHEIEARPSRARRDKAVEAEEKRCVCDFLRPRVLPRRVARRIDAQLLQSREAGEPERLGRSDLQLADEPFDLRREHGLHREERVDFGDRAILLERRVEDVEGAVAPSAPRWAAESWIPAGADDAPNLDVERLASEPVEGVEQSEIARSAAVLRHSGVSPRIQRLDDGEDLLGSALIDQVDGALVLEHRMSSMQPKPRLVRRVKIGQPVHHIAEFGDDSLGPEVRRRLAARPARDGGRRYGDDVGDVFALKRAAIPKALQNSADCGRHGSRLFRADDYISISSCQFMKSRRRFGGRSARFRLPFTPFLPAASAARTAGGATSSSIRAEGPRALKKRPLTPAPVRPRFKPARGEPPF